MIWTISRTIRGQQLEEMLGGRMYAPRVTSPYSQKMVGPSNPTPNIFETEVGQEPFWVYSHQSILATRELWHDSMVHFRPNSVVTGSDSSDPSLTNLVTPTPTPSFRSNPHLWQKRRSTRNATHQEPTVLTCRSQKCIQRREGSERDLATSIECFAEPSYHGSFSEVGERVALKQPFRAVSSNKSSTSRSKRSTYMNITCGKRACLFLCAVHACWPHDASVTPGIASES